MIGKDFITAGNAIFTIEIPADAGQEKNHYTFRVRIKEATEQWPEACFVSILSGPDNESDYTYMGMMDKESGVVRLTNKSKMTTDSYPFRLLNRILFRVWREESGMFESLGYKLHHEGKCGRCGRTLTTPESVESGIGPVCAKKGDE